jgi:hypothetical protein
MSLHKRFSKLRFLIRKKFVLDLNSKGHGKIIKRVADKLHYADSQIVQDIDRRINYYCSLEDSFLFEGNPTALESERLGVSRTQMIDYQCVRRFFDPALEDKLVTGDNVKNPLVPAFCKSRPLRSPNRNAVLLKLNEFRHYYWRKDPVAFREKKASAVWRGACYQPIRKLFIEAARGRSAIDAVDVRGKEKRSPSGGVFLSIRDQMEYRYIISLEGNDVATNLKWIMRSNSVCMMPKPRYETWFMEGLLVPFQHYIEIKDDFSDIEEMIEYYEMHPKEAREIVDEASRYTERFYRNDLELVIQVLVMLRYFVLSGQVTAERGIDPEVRKALQALPVALRQTVGLK